MLLKKCFLVHFFLVTIYEVQCDHQPASSYQFVYRDFGHFSTFYDTRQESRWFCFIFGICHSPWDPSWAAKPDLRTVYQWSQLEFDYRSESDRQADLHDGTFVPGAAAPIDVDVHYSRTPNQKNRIFITIPRFQEGIPVTFGIVTNKKYNNNPVIAPFPSWEWQRDSKFCKSDRLVSVFRVQIDECQRLWVLDAGKIAEQQLCPPQILVFDLHTNRVIHKYEIPASQYASISIFVTPIVDVRDAHRNCKDTFVYIADCQAYGMVVYDYQRDRSWKVTDKTMFPHPSYGTFNILGDSFDLMDGILGMSLSPFQPGQDRILFYHAMASPTENWVKTSDLRNESRFINNPASSPEIFHTFRGQRTTQSAAEAIDRNGIMYFGLMSDVTLDCWNTNSEYDSRNIEVIANNKQTLQFASGIKVIQNSRADEELWVLTSRFQKVATGTIKNSEINFRIQVAKVDDLIFSTVCKRKGGNPSQQGSGGFGFWTTPKNPARKPYK